MTDLRTFAEEAYAQAGVAAVALRLQDDHGADINLLLAAAWLAQQGYRLGSGEAHELATHCREWRDAVLLPQRVLRRRLKSLAPELYPQALELELAMERWQLDRLAGWLSAQMSATGPPIAAARGRALLAENLEAALQPTRVAPPEGQPSQPWREELAQLVHLLPLA